MKETIKWATATLIICITLCFLMPVNIYHSMLYLIATVGAVALTFTMLKLLGSIFLKELNSAVSNVDISEEERNEAIAKAYNPTGCVILPVIMVLFFGAVSLFVFCEVNMEKNEIEKYGQLTLATVSNGSSISSSRFDFSDIYLAFKASNGDSVFIKHSVTASQFQEFYKNQTLPIIYSSRYPSIIKVVSTPEDLEKYLKRSDTHKL